MYQLNQFVKEAFNYILSLPYHSGQVLIVVLVIVLAAIVESNLDKDEKEGKWGKIK
jgi:hypothetical protein